MVSTVELRERFSVFAKAAEEFIGFQTSPLTEDDLESLLGCAVSSMAKILPIHQHFAVYRAVVMFLGYKDWTSLLDILEDSIKETLSELGKTFVGYKER